MSRHWHEDGIRRVRDLCDAVLLQIGLDLGGLLWPVVVQTIEVGGLDLDVRLSVNRFTRSWLLRVDDLVN